MSACFRLGVWGMRGWCHPLTLQFREHNFNCMKKEEPKCVALFILQSGPPIMDLIYKFLNEGSSQSGPSGLHVNLAGNNGSLLFPESIRFVTCIIGYDCTILFLKSHTFPTWSDFLPFEKWESYRSTLVLDKLSQLFSKDKYHAWEFLFYGVFP